MAFAWGRQDIDQIARSVLFTNLDQESLNSILAEGAPTDFSKGDLICRQGEPAEFCHLVLNGTVKLSRNAGPDAAAVISIHRPTQSFMEGDSFSGGSYSTTAEAITNCRIARFDATKWRLLIGQQPSIALAMLGSASVHLRILLGQVEKLKTMTASARLADFILNLVGPGGGAKIATLPYEKQMIAAQLGITPESFSRTLGQLRSYGVTVTKNHVEVADTALLRRIVSRDDA